MVKKAHYAVFVILALATSLCYWPGLSGPFLFDDLPNILANTRLHITELNWDTILGAITSIDSGPLKRPISMASFALNHYFFGLSPFAFKAINLFIHILNAAALYVLALLLLENINKRETHSISPKFTFWLAAAATLLWTIHPLNLSSVLYIVQRMTSLSALFTVLGLIGYCIGRNRLIEGDKHGLFIAIASVIFFGVLAVLSKENGVLIFAYALVIEIFVYQLKTAKSIDPLYKKALVTFFLAPIVVGLIALLLYGDTILRLKNYEIRQFTLAERLMTESRILWFYLRLIAAPVLSELGLYHDYIPISLSLTQPLSTLISIVGLLTLTVVGVIVRNSLPILSFAIFWFLAGHSIESSVIPLELAHEHRNYLPMYGPVLATSYYLLYLANKPDSLKLWTGLFIIILGLFGAATAARSHTWSNDFRMKLKQLQDHPYSARANSDMAILLHSNRRFDEAEKMFKRAASIDPEPPHQLLRLLQHLYVTYKPVPRDHLDTLDYCAANTPYSQVTVWQYESLLKQSRHVPADYERIFGAFHTMVNSERIMLSTPWAAKSQYLLGENYMYMKKYKEAITAYAKAGDTDPNPVYTLRLANAYYYANYISEARATITNISSSDSLPEGFRKDYDKLLADLKQKTGDQ